jgi:hypothetical protein
MPVEELSERVLIAGSAFQADFPTQTVSSRALDALF